MPTDKPHAPDFSCAVYEDIYRDVTFSPGHATYRSYFGSAQCLALLSRESVSSQIGFPFESVNNG
jgi:hypothetical protein